MTVIEFFGLQALALALFYLAGNAVRLYDYTWPIGPKLLYWGGMGAIVGLPVYMGLTVFFPTLPLI